MNIAFPAIFALALVIPGFVFLHAFYRTESTSIDSKPFDFSFAVALMLAFCLHAFYIFTLPALYPDSFSPLPAWKIDYSVCIKLLTGNELTDEQIDNLKTYIFPIGLYFFSLYALAFVAGKISQKAFLKIFPYKSSLLSFDTPWYYELKGNLSSAQDAQIIKLSCLEDFVDGSYLYYGVLEDFYLKNDGQLDRIVLSNVSRRKLVEDDLDDDTERFYQIKGDRLVFWCDRIKNINIEYLYIYPEGKAEPEISSADENNIQRSPDAADAPYL